MNKEKQKEFLKRYDKFKKNNLPTPFWDEERQTLEYVSYDNELDYWNNIFKSEDEDYDRRLNIYPNLIEALEDLANTGFYYSYTSGYFTFAKKEDTDHHLKIKRGHTHSHTFESVVQSLYEFPESFHISKEEEQFYSKQQLEYLRRVQKYLLFLGIKDLTTDKPSVQRYRNQRQKKYGSAYIHTYQEKTIKDFISGKRNFIVLVPSSLAPYQEYEEYPNHDKKELVVDTHDNFRMFIEYTHREIKKYKEIKKIYKNENLKDEDKVLVEYFKILEIFE